MLHETHAGVTGPTLLVVVANNVFIVGIRMLCKVSLNQVTRLLCTEPMMEKTEVVIKV